MGSLALLPLGFALAGPLAAAFGERAVLGAGSVAAFVLLALALVPRSTRSLGGERRPGRSAEQLARDVGVELGREPEVADVDALVGVVHERSRL
jgi:hypothetical protein